MKIKIMIFLIFSILSSNLYAYNEEAKPGKYKDFGIEAETYPILEEDFIKILKKEAKKLKISKKKTRETLEKAVTKAAFFESKTKLCQKKEEGVWEKDYYTLKTDLYNPMGRIWRKAGTQLLAPKFPAGIVKRFCFISGKNIIAATNQISYFKKEVGDCLYLVNNMDVRKLIKKFPAEKIYPNMNAIKERFDLKCVPSMITFKEDERKINYYDYEYFKTND